MLRPWNIDIVLDDQCGKAIYLQIADLYEMYYFDKKATWVSSNNNNFLKKNLADCEIGFQQAQNNLTIQEALRNNNNNNNK